MKLWDDKMWQQQDIGEKLKFIAVVDVSAVDLKIKSQNWCSFFSEDEVEEEEEKNEVNLLYWVWLLP